MNLIEFFEKIPKKTNDIVFFDIDETLLEPYTNKPIIPVLEFYKYLVKHGYNIAIITARVQTKINYEYTINDLESIGIKNDYKFLVLRPPEINDIKEYKKTARKKIVEQGFNPLMSIGDMHWDMGEYGGIGIIVLSNN
jgi:predicted secreted acid phosphatase